MDNQQLADHLNELADLLEAQSANVYRVRAYRLAAQRIQALNQPVAGILQSEGSAALLKLPGIGESLARSIEQLVQSGRLGLLERLRGDTNVERVLGTVAGIGPKTAARIHEQLGIETLAELEAAAYDGRLAQLPGFGRKRLQAVAESLAGRFRRRPSVATAKKVEPKDLPPVAELLDVDDEYREKAQGSRLIKIAPRRFNPTGEAWLPILHTQRGDRHYTALYSNTARAHELGTEKDWIVIYRDDPDGDGQWTMVTSLFGPLKGRRIVRGRENECADYYRAEDTRKSELG